MICVFESSIVSTTKIDQDLFPGFQILRTSQIHQPKWFNMNPWVNMTTQKLKKSSDNAAANFGALNWSLIPPKITRVVGIEKLLQVSSHLSDFEGGTH